MCVRQSYLSTAPSSNKGRLQIKKKYCIQYLDDDPAVLGAQFHMPRVQMSFLMPRDAGGVEKEMAKRPYLMHSEGAITTIYVYI